MLRRGVQLSDRKAPSGAFLFLDAGTNVSQLDLWSGCLGRMPRIGGLVVSVRPISAVQPTARLTIASEVQRPVALSNGLVCLVHRRLLAPDQLIHVPQRHSALWRFHGDRRAGP